MRETTASLRSAKRAAEEEAEAAARLAAAERERLEALLARARCAAPPSGPTATRSLAPLAPRLPW